MIRDPAEDRRYALEFARGALEHYYSVGPGQLALRERTTNLTTGDLLATAVEQLLDELDPRGPRPWLRKARSDQWRPPAGDPGTTVTMTEVYGDEGWPPGFPCRH